MGLTNDLPWPESCAMMALAAALAASRTCAEAQRKTRAGIMWALPSACPESPAH